jgi:hypothetical protein
MVRWLGKAASQEVRFKPRVNFFAGFGFSARFFNYLKDFFALNLPLIHRVLT